MYISKKNREIIKNKYGGRCAYSGTILEDDWQIDHVKPIIRNLDGTIKRKNLDCFENLVPCQKLINHYKGACSLESFRNWLLGDLHLRLRKLPKNTRLEKTKKRKEYILKVASYFNITEEKPFSKVFYFETLNNQQ